MSIKSKIENLSLGEVIWDTGEKASIPGLHIKRHKTKTSYYLFYRQKDGKEKRPLIGYYPVFSLSDARDVSKNILKTVASGIDPFRDQAALKVQDLFENIRTNKWDGSKSWDREATRIYRKEIESPFGKLPVHAVTTRMVFEWHKEKEKTPFKANRCLSVLNSIFNYAKKTGLISEIEYSSPEKFKESKRRRHPNRDELSKILEVLKSDYDFRPKEVTYLYCLCFTSARPSVFLNAKRSEIFEEGDFGVLNTKGKSGEIESIIIPPKIMDLVKKLPSRVDGKLFGIPAPQRYWKTVVKRAKCEDVWMRDFRRSFASVALNSGKSLSQIAEVLHHKNTTTTMRYAHLSNERRMTLVKDVAETIGF